MGTRLRILVPEETTNYILNPAMRYDTTGWRSAGSAAPAISLDYARFNIASLKVVTNGIALYEGTYYEVSSLTGVKEQITVSAYVRGAGIVKIGLVCNPAGQNVYSAPITLRSDRWQRIEVTGITYGSSDVRLYVLTDGVAQAVTFYVDGAQMEKKPYATTYCDGNQTGCTWNLVDHASTSTRNGNTRAGGKWVTLSETCRRDDDIYVTVLNGLGMAPIVNNTQSWAQAPGSYFQNTKILDRVVILSFNVKNKNFHVLGDPDTSKLHKLRQQLIDVFKPDRTGGGEPFLFEYDAGDIPLYIWMRYEAGLEGQWDVRNQWKDSFPVRLVAVDPMMVEDNQNVKQLKYKKIDFQKGSSYNSLGITRKLNSSDGRWDGFQIIGFGAYHDHDLFSFFQSGKGEMYFSGENNSGVFSFVKYAQNGTFTGDWALLGGSKIVSDTAVAPNGDLYVCGSFTSINGVAANNVAKWDGSTWTALGSGLNSNARTICYAPNGQIYVGGDFTTAGGVTVNYIARWDGLWRTVGTPPGLNDSVYKIIDGKDGRTIYCCGRFTQASSGGALRSRIASIDINTNLFTNISGFGDKASDMVIGKDGRLYAAGDFTTDINTSALYYVAVYNGQKWFQVGDLSLSGGPSNSSVSGGRCMGVASDGSIYVMFKISTPTSNSINIQKWSNGTWSSVGFKPSSFSGVDGIMIDYKDNLLVLIRTATTSNFMSDITVVNNTGTSEVQPTIYIKGQGYLTYIENNTTKKRVYFNLDVKTGEEVFINFATKRITSIQRGDLPWTLLNGSDFGSFALSPGDNNILALMYNEVAASMQISYIPTHWGANAVVTPEALE